MTETTGRTNPAVVSPRSSPLNSFVFGGFAVGLLSLAAMHLASRVGPGGRPTAWRDMPLTTFLIVFPAVGAGLGYLVYRHPDARGWRRPATFFAVEPFMESTHDRERRQGRIRRYVWTGVVAGNVVGLVTAALDFAWRGWPFLGLTTVIGLTFCPYFGALMGFNLGLRPGDPKPSLRKIRFGLGTMMILVAYIACWLGLTMQALSLSAMASVAHSKAINSELMTDVFGKILATARVDAERSKNAQELRNGRIPDGIMPSQKEFLKSLDATATQEYKTYRYGLIADGEDLRARYGVENARTFGRLVNYHKALASKYRKAEQAPWLPIPPDPPPPQ